MESNVTTIFFDVGATLRYVVEDPAFADAACLELMRLVGTQEPRAVFFEKLNRNWNAYRHLAKTSLLDVSEMELWVHYLLPDESHELGQIPFGPIRFGAAGEIGRAHV